MTFTLRPMMQDEALQIAEWHYASPYDFYDLSADEEDMAEFLDFEAWEPSVYFSVVDEHEVLSGFFTYGHHEDAIDVGLGMHPQLTGKHLGVQFCLDGLNFAKQQFQPDAFRLSVAAFNHRAIRVYEHIGFQSVRTFLNPTNGGVYEFIEMTMRAVVLR